VLVSRIEQLTELDDAMKDLGEHMEQLAAGTPQRDRSIKKIRLAPAD
jgi:hypothetical protein